MFALLMMSIVAFAIYLLIAVGGAAAGGDARAKVLKTGTDARGIILWADNTSSGRVTVNGARYERRSVRLDVEVPGRDPYEVQVTPLFPRVCEALPGSTLDLRVDPKDPGNIAVIGPAGSIGWMSASPLLFPLLFPPVGAGCFRPMGALFFLPVIAMFFILGEVTGGHEAKKGSASHASTAHEWCAAATRCCNKISPPAACRSFKTMSETACKSALEGERKAAAKLKRVCE